MWSLAKKTTQLFVFILIIQTCTAFPKRSINNEKSKNLEISKDQDQLMVETVTKNHQTISKRKDSESSMEESADDSTSYPNYSFSYEVRDPTTGDDKQHEEKRDGDFVQGQYSYIEPDGGRRIVAYQSNGTEGFNAIVLKINASELVLPMEEETSNTPTDNIQQEYEISSKLENKDCEQQLENSNAQPLESKIPNESKTYIEMESLQQQQSEYQLSDSNRKKLSLPVEAGTETKEDHNVEFIPQTIIMNYEDQSKEMVKSSTTSNENSNIITQKSELTNSEVNHSQQNEIQELQGHMVSYPMAIMHAHVYPPMPLLLRLIPSSTNLQENQTIEEQNENVQSKIVDNNSEARNNNDDSNTKSDRSIDNHKNSSNISKRSKKTRRHNVSNTNRNSKTRKLRVSYKLNEHDNQSQIPSRKVNDIRKRGTEIKQENGGHKFESYW